MHAACCCHGLGPVSIHHRTPTGCHISKTVRHHPCRGLLFRSNGLQRVGDSVGTPHLGSTRASSVEREALWEALSSFPYDREQMLEDLDNSLDDSVRGAALEVWTVRMDKLQRRRACDMRDLTINPAHLLGISPAKAKAAGGLPSLDTFVNVKQKHPTRPVLLRTGSFYEAIGFDAVMLVEVCGLNPMALDKGMPKAGLRADNLSKQLQALLDAGLEVVMVERYGVDRAIAKVVTLASPSYIPPNLELLLNNSPHARQVNT